MQLFCFLPLLSLAFAWNWQNACNTKPDEKILELPGSFWQTGISGARAKEITMIRFRAIDREALDVKSSGDRRKRVDAYFVEFDCPADDINPEPHIWICRFEVPRGSQFLPRNFPDKKEAQAFKGYTI